MQRDNEYVSEDCFTKGRASAILRLLDDESEFVRRSVARELERHPKEGEIFLRKVSEGEDEGLAMSARALLEHLGWVDGVKPFLQFIRSLKYELETGWLLLDRVAYPTLDVSGTLAFLDEVARRCGELLTPPNSARERCMIMNRVIFHEYGFHGATKDFADPENSFLHKVVERRRGLPITLSAIYLLVARRMEFELEPIGLPGRFMVGYFGDERPFYVDAWSGGRIREVGELEAFLNLEGVPAEECSGALLPVTSAETLIRACRNLTFQYKEAGDTANAKLFRSFVREFQDVLRREANA